MNIFLNLNGTAQIINSVPIYQGSNAVTDIIVQSYMPVSTAMELYFILPDDNATQVGPFVMTPITPFSGTGELHYWSWPLKDSVTALAGRVNVIVNAISGVPPNEESGGQNTTSFSCGFDVIRGVLPSFPTYPPTQDQWQLILQYMQNAFVVADKTMKAVNPIQIRTFSVTLSSGAAAYADLQLIYDGILIKYWSSVSQSWTQVNPNPENPDVNKWIYNFIFGLPRSDIPGPPGPSVAAGAQNIIFYAADWQGTAGAYVYEIPNTIHHLGATPNIGVFVMERSDIEGKSLYEDYSVNDDGLVVIASREPFDGYALLVAGVSINGANYTQELNVTNPSIESIVGSALNQSEINQQLVTFLNSLVAQNKYVLMSTIPAPQLVIPFATHQKVNPVVSVFDADNGKNITQEYIVDEQNNITILTEIAFNAKIIIQ